MAQVLRYLTESLGGRGVPNLLVGLEAADDAAVYKLSPEQAVVLTVDFFAPLVDDPYAYGAIAAANAMSDVYAMGAEVALALNVAAFPEDFPLSIITDILRGGADKVAEAGGVIAGGHTILDAEPKYGLCVLGTIHPDKLLTRAGARVGDVLYLSKPLGTGIITTAAKLGKAKQAHLEAAIATMTQLNRHPSHLVREVGAHCLMDVTGFGLLGHACEMAQASGLALRIEASAVPLLEGALEYAAQGLISGGDARNRHYFSDKVRLPADLPEEMKGVLFDPQTSGGLLFAVAPQQAAVAERRFAESGLRLWRIGQVIAGQAVEVVP